VLNLLAKTMIASNSAKGFVLDGFPRAVDQGVKFESNVGFNY